MTKSPTIYIKEIQKYERIHCCFYTVKTTEHSCHGLINEWETLGGFVERHLEIIWFSKSSRFESFWISRLIHCFDLLYKVKYEVTLYLIFTVMWRLHSWIHTTNTDSCYTCRFILPWSAETLPLILLKTENNVSIPNLKDLTDFCEGLVFEHITSFSINKSIEKS